MCGLFGASSNYLSDSEIENVVDLGVISSLRGKHSAGVLLVASGKKDKTCRTLLTKRLGSSASLMSSAEVLTELYNPQNNDKFVILGHARQATLGRITQENAHPFVCEHIIGAHNGTIDAFIERVKVERKYKDKNEEKTEVSYEPVDPTANDSRILFSKISAQGPCTTLKEVEEVGGAAAISFIDTKEQTLNLYRNEKRPLYVAYSTDNSTVYWCSEDSMLNIVRSRENRWAFGPPFLLIPGVLYTFELGKIARASCKTRHIIDNKGWYLKSNYKSAGFNQEEHELSRNNNTLIQLHKDRVADNSRGNSRGEGATTVIGGTEKSAGNFSSGHSKAKEIVWTGFYPFQPISEEKANTLLAVGCEMCNGTSTVYDTTWWFGGANYLCNDCKETPFAKEYINYQRLVESTFDWR